MVSDIGQKILNGDDNTAAVNADVMVKAIENPSKLKELPREQLEKTESQLYEVHTLDDSKMRIYREIMTFACRHSV